MISGRISLPICAALCFLLSRSPAPATVTLASIFGNDMVLQREQPVQLWGWADTAEKVTVRQDGVVLGNAVGQGKDKAWHIILPALAAGPVGDICISGTNSITLTNLLAGDVWLCSGQSNMEFTLRRMSPQHVGGVQDAEKEIAAADYPQIRYNQDAGKGWIVCTPGTAPALSAVAYFFARDLHLALKVPIGLVVRARGGTPGEFWTPASALANDAEFTQQQAQAKALRAKLEPLAAPYKRALATWNQVAKEAQSQGKPAPSQTVLPMTKDQVEQYGDTTALLNPGPLYPLIHELAPMNFKGAVWYQGEANVRRADHYAHLLSLLIQGWRADWGVSFPFLIVQLPNYGAAVPVESRNSFALLREAQMKATQIVPDVGIIPTLDVGEMHNLHPLNKQTVGYRLAQLALKMVYGRDVVASGPRFHQAAFRGGNAIVGMEKDDNNLVLKGDAGFQLAGADHRWHSAMALIQGETLEVSSPDVAQPVAVRYDYVNGATASLFNREGWPAFPFRSDTWVDSLTVKAEPSGK